MSKSKDKHIVYQAKVYGEVVYIGSGALGREKHCNSGCSHLYELNRLHFEGVNIVVIISHYNLSKEESIRIEKELIIKHQPKYNTIYKNPISSTISKMQLSTYVSTTLSSNMRSQFGDNMYFKYEESVREIVAMIGISKLAAGCYMPSDSYGRKALETARARTLYYKIRFKESTEAFMFWLQTVFDIEKEGQRIWLKIKPEITEKFISLAA